MNHSRFDLKVLIASLFAATAVVGTFLVYELSVQQDKNLERATAAARLVRALPFSRLHADLQEQSYTELFRHLARDSRFAYAQVDDGNGNIVGEAYSAGTIPPDLPAPESTNTRWLDRIDIPDLSGKTAFELRGPLAGSHQGGRYRLAYFEPVVVDLVGSVSYLASMILPIFLLVPLLLLLLRREIRPIQGLARSISEEKNTEQTSVGNDITGFVSQFNGFLDQAQHRIAGYQQERDKLVTTERFLNYRVLKLESILHAINSGLAIVDTHGKATFCNELFAQYTGQSIDSLVGRQPADWQLAAEFQALASLGSVNSRSQRQLSDIDPVHMPGVTLRLSTQNVRKPHTSEHAGQILILQDVSGERLAQNSRGEFVGHVAHELKTPLNTLALCVQSIQGPDGEDPQTRGETLNIIGDEVDRLATLINNLLSITQMEMGTMVLKPVRVRLSDLLNDAVSSVSRSDIAAGQRFSVSVEEGVDTVQVDKPLFRIALNNLLTNAVKYSDKKGVVAIAARESADFLEISVKDDGIGIPSEEKELIFEKFARGTGAQVVKRSGHGLGLALTKDIVALHHGSIRVESEAGKGSTFTIELRRDSGVLRKTL